MVEPLIGAISIALEAGDWARVVEMVPVVRALAIEAADTEFADVLADLLVIAQDAVEHPELGPVLLAQAVVEVVS